ncbi:MAG: hypothetical protein QNK37_34540 [Acidobacteriota bacterium]|nr:hypothetical protein [Acidobacteriota bacterium]
MPKQYQLPPEKIKDFGTIYLLERMVNGPRSFSVLLEGSDTHLEELLTSLMSKELVDIDARNRYVPTQKGRRAVTNFMDRYIDFLKNFDCYCAVDLEEGEFAFEEFFEIEDESEWVEYLEQDRWEDLRVAVAEFKSLDPLEIVFMGFINEERVQDKNDGWQFDLVLGSLWDDIVKICNSALQAEDLAYEDEEGSRVSGEDVLKDVLKEGADLNLRLRKQEDEYGSDWAKEDKTVYAGEPRAVPPVPKQPLNYTVYESYRDPYYTSPVWKKKKYWDWD